MSPLTGAGFENHTPDPTKINKTNSTTNSYNSRMSDSDLQNAVMALLQTAGELSDAQAALDRDHELTTAPRDQAARKVCDAFRAFNRFAAGAQAAKKSLTIKITLSPQPGSICT
jgi:hypothetical protein